MVRPSRFLLLGWAILAFAVPASSCDFYARQVGHGFSLEYHPKGSGHYNYSLPPYERDAYSLTFNGVSEGYREYINVSIAWPESPTPEQAIAAGAKADVIVYWGSKIPPPEDSSITMRSAGKEIARLDQVQFLNSPSATASFDRYWFRETLPVLNRMSAIDVQIEDPDGLEFTSRHYDFPNWPVFERHLKSKAKVLRADAKGRGRYCGTYPIAN